MKKRISIQKEAKSHVNRFKSILPILLNFSVGSFLERLDINLNLTYLRMNLNQRSRKLTLLIVVFMCLSVGAFAQDTDMDGINDDIELLEGTDPNDENDTPVDRMFSAVDVTASTFFAQSPPVNLRVDGTLAATEIGSLPRYRKYPPQNTNFDQWLSSGVPAPHTLTFDLGTSGNEVDGVYIWQLNRDGFTVAWGSKDYDLEYATVGNPTNFISLGSYVLPVATEGANVEAVTVTFNPIEEVRFMRIIINSNHAGSSSFTGLGKVRFQALDTDGDGIFNSIDPDDDNDGVADVSDAFRLNASASVDTDADGMPDDCVGGNCTGGLVLDPDDDNDGVADISDPFPLNASASVDTDADGMPDDCVGGICTGGLILDTDDDNDTILDINDAFPSNASASVDTDADGMPDDCISGNCTGGLVLDADDDNDTVLDVNDAFPLNASASVDTDTDGMPDDCAGGICTGGLVLDTDDDNDGFTDDVELLEGTNPADASSTPIDKLFNAATVTSNSFFSGGTAPEFLIGGGNLNAVPSGSLPRYRTYAPYPNINFQWVSRNDHPGQVIVTFGFGTDGVEIAGAFFWNYHRSDGASFLGVEDFTFEYETIDNPGVWQNIGDFTLTLSPGTGNIAAQDIIFSNPVNNAQSIRMVINRTGFIGLGKVRFQGVDTDGDGLVNRTDTDDDNDGVPDVTDAFRINASASVDTDLDGMPDDCISGNCTGGLVLDTDDDNDTVLDIEDAFPLNASASVDTDSDGMPDDCISGTCTGGLVLDDDDDNDSILDVADNCPITANMGQSDADLDGVGDVCDSIVNATMQISAPSAMGTTGADVSYTITYNNASSISLTASDISINTTGNATATAIVSGTGLSTRTVTLTSFGGTNGTIGISIAANTANNSTSDGLSNAAGPSTTFELTDTDNDGLWDPIDNCPLSANADQLDSDNDGIGDVCDPSVNATAQISAPSVIMSSGEDVSYTITYTDAGTITLAPSDIVLNTTGDAGATVEVTGTGLSSRTVTLTSISGSTGTLGISLNAGTANNVAGNGPAVAVGPSATFSLLDTDGDGVLDSNDNCLSIANADQLNTDGADDGGDACDINDDNDGFNDDVELSEGTDPLDAGSEPIDKLINATTATASSFLNGATAPSFLIGDANFNAVETGSLPLYRTYVAYPDLNLQYVSSNTHAGQVILTFGFGVDGVDIDGAFFWNYHRSDNASHIGVQDFTLEYETIDNPGVWQNIGDYSLTLSTGTGDLAPEAKMFDSVLENVRSVRMIINRTGFIGLGKVRFHGVDTDGDGMLNEADTDDDGDGVLDVSDNCRLTINPDQTDANMNGIGDVCDPNAIVIAQIGSPAYDGTNISYEVNYTYATDISLSPSDIIVNASGDGAATVAVSGTGTTSRTVTLSDIIGSSGDIGISLPAGTADNAFGTGPANAAGPSTTMSFQTINFGTLINSNLGDADFNLTATASSGFDVTYESSNTSVATISGNTVTIVGIGTTTITASQAGNTTFLAASSVDQTLTVDPFNTTISLNLSGINPIYAGVGQGITPTANDLSSNPTLALVSEYSVQGANAFSTTLPIDAGIYDVRVNLDASETNYSAPEVTGTFTIDQAPLTITADSRTITYGDDQNIGHTVAYSGFVNGETNAVLGGSLTFGNITEINTGSYTEAIVPSGLTSSNYNINFVNGNLTIDPLAITVTADAVSKTYGNSDPTLSYQLTTGALQFSDTFSGTLTRVAGENIGNYAINQGTLDAGNNYLITYISDDLTISKRAIEVTADAQSKAFGEVDPIFTYSITGGTLIGMDEFSGTLKRASGENVGNYAITQGSLTAGTNYALTYIANDLTINIANQTITFGTLSGVMFGDANFSLGATASSGLTLSYTSSDPTVATVSGNTITITGVGTTNITASQAGDANFNGALDAVQSLTVTHGNYERYFVKVNAIFGMTATNTPILVKTLSAAEGQNIEALLKVGNQIWGTANSGGANNTGTLFRMNPDGSNFEVLHDFTVAEGNPRNDMVVVGDATVYGVTGDYGVFSISATDPVSGPTFYNGYSGANQFVTGLTYHQDKLWVSDNSSIIVGINTDFSGYEIASQRTSSGGFVSGNPATDFIVEGYRMMENFELSNVAFFPHYANVFVPSEDWEWGSANEDVANLLSVPLEDIHQTKIIFADGQYFHTFKSGGQFGVEITEEDHFNSTLGFGSVSKAAIPALNGAIGATSLASLSKPYFNLYDAKDSVIWGIRGDATTGLFEAFSHDLTTGTYQAYDFGNGNLNAGVPNVGFFNFRRTATLVTQDQTKAFGDPIPSLTYEIWGLDAGDDASTIGGVVTSAEVIYGANLQPQVPLTSTSHPGMYPIKAVADTANGQYDLRHLFGNLTITYGIQQSDIEFNPAGTSFTFDGTAKAFTAVGKAGTPAGSSGITFDLSGSSLIATDFDYTYAASTDNGETYTVDLGTDAPINVGKYRATATVKSDNQVYSGSATFDFEIEPRELFILPDPVSKTYDGVGTTTDPEIGYFPLGIPRDASNTMFTGALSRAEGSDVGAYPINLGNLSAGSNYVLSLFTGGVRNLNITPLDVTITPDPNQGKVYDGSSTATDPTLTYTGNLLGSDTFTGALTRAAGTDVNTYAIEIGTLSAGDNYNLNVAIETFEITQRNTFIMVHNQTKTYGNADPELTFELAPGSSLVGSDTFTGALARDLGEDVDMYLITEGTLTAGSNYSLNFFPANLTIEQRGLTITADDKTKNVGTADPSLTYTITSGALVGSDLLTGALTRVIGETPGDYAIQQGTLSAGSNYNINFTDGTFTITDKTPQTITFAPLTQVTYGGASFDLMTTGGASGNPVTFVSSNPAVATVSGNTVTIISAGATTITASQVGDATFANASDVNQVLTVNPANITVTADIGQNKVYTDADPTLTYTITSGALIGMDVLSGVLDRAVGEDAGSYAIGQGTLANANYNITFVSNDFEITTRAITVTADFAQFKIFGDADPTFTYQITSGALIGTDVLLGALSRDAGENVGFYPITQGTLANANYNITFVSNNFLIAGRSITVTVDAGQSKVYGEADPILTYQITSGSLLGSDMFSGALSRTVGEDVGTYAIGFGTLSAGTNYNVTFISNNLSITTRPLTITADPGQVKTYGQADPVFTHQVTAGSLVGTDTFSGNLGRVAGETVGAYAVNQGSLTLGSNYDLSFTSADFTVDLRPVTITANDFSKFVGESDPALTYTLTAGTLAFSDMISGTLVRESGETVGNYAINQGSVEINSNYDITFIPGTLTITDLITQTIVFNALPERTFGDADFDLIATGGGSSNPITFSSSNTDVATISGSTVTVVGAGMTNITASQSGDVTYAAAADVIQPLVVAKLSQIITFDPLSTVTQGDAAFDLIATGGASGNAVTYSSSDPSIASIAGNTVTIGGFGTVTITASQAGNANYEAATSVGQLLTVEKLFIWNGVNWNNGAPTASDNARITGNYTTSVNGQLSINNLEVMNGATLTVDNNRTLTVNGDLDSEGLLHITSGASLINSGNISGTGYQIDRTTTFDANTGRYSIVGSPVEASGFDVLGMNAWIFGYDESELFNSDGNLGLDRFKTPTELNQTIMSVGHGYFSAFTGDMDGLITFSGTPNTGTITVPLIYTDHGVPAEVPFQGFNLISNPYPSAIDVIDFLNSNSSSAMTGSIYLWDDNNSADARGDDADYLVVNQMGNTDSRNNGEAKFDEFIRSGQGFFVKATAATSIVFNNEMRFGGNNDDGGFFREETGNTDVTTLKLLLGNGSISKATVVGFANDATEENDPRYDALKLGGNGFGFYSLMDDEQLAIQGLPSNYSKEIAMGINIPETGNYTISLNELESTETLDVVFLKDQLTGEIVNLREGKYSFNAEAGRDETRFILQAFPSTVTETEELLEHKIYSYATEKELHVVFKQGEYKIGQFVVYDLNGKIVLNKKEEIENNRWFTDTSNLSANLYILMVVTENGTWRQKIRIQ